MRWFEDARDSGEVEKGSGGLRGGGWRRSRRGVAASCCGSGGNLDTTRKDEATWLVVINGNLLLAKNRDDGVR